MPMEIQHNESHHRFQTDVGGRLALLAYARHGDRLALVHTEVPPELGGQGIGGRLARTALDFARTQGLRVYPFCPFVRAWLRRHPEYDELVQGVEDWSSEA